MVELAPSPDNDNFVADANAHLRIFMVYAGCSRPRALPQPKEAILLRIFLVDDNAMARGAIKAALQRHADWVVAGETCSGPESSGDVRRYRRQLTVMDFRMPEMNGLETARRLTAPIP